MRINSPFTARVDRWPTLFVAWMIACFHMTLACAVAHEPRITVLFVFNGLQDLPRLLGNPELSIFLAVISTFTMISLLGEEYLHRWAIILLMLPQYLLVLYGVGTDLVIITTGQYQGVEYPRWFIVAGVSAFVWMGFWHTISIILRVRYWMLQSRYRSRY